MEKIEGIILTLVILSGIVGLYFIYAGVGFAGLQLDQKDYLRADQDHSLRLYGGLTPQKEGEWRLVDRLPGERPTAETGKISLLGFEAGKVLLRVEDRFGVHDLPPLDVNEVWSDEIIAVRIMDINPSRGEAVIRFLSNKPQICIGGWVFSLEAKERICPDMKSPAEMEWKLSTGVWGQTPGFP